MYEVIEQFKDLIKIIKDCITYASAKTFTYFTYLLTVQSFIATTRSEQCYLTAYLATQTRPTRFTKACCRLGLSASKAQSQQAIFGLLGLFFASNALLALPALPAPTSLNIHQSLLQAPSTIFCEKVGLKGRDDFLLKRLVKQILPD